jgi:hypothetical protein
MLKQRAVLTTPLRPKALARPPVFIDFCGEDLFYIAYGSRGMKAVRFDQLDAVASVIAGHGVYPNDCGIAAETRSKGQ